jgi:hypothetical protein
MIFLRLPLCAALLLSASIAIPLEAPSEQAGAVRLDDRTPYFELRSDRSVGDYGEELLDVSYRGPDCGTQWRFDHAELQVLNNRFGDVQFLALPETGCIDCEPVRLRWMHEPTGHLEFNVNVYRRQYHVPCP